jgi:trehalose 6-phosphate phosphatase
MSEHSKSRSPTSALHQPLEAVLFDMDGVITDTAKAHAAAWQRLFDEFLKERAAHDGKEFQSFDPKKEYRQYVDGKPRYDGVKSFLDSRGIELPYGHKNDGPDRVTVCGLGNRKDRHFQSWLEDHQVRSYPGTVSLLKDLRQMGVKTAVFSASCNAEAVLRNAGVFDLFDAKVDGRDLARLGLPGKPDPAMLLEAGRLLGVAPWQTAVFEDAIAGVEAGVAGGFSLVIGVARGDGAGELQRAGAHLLVHDLSELILTENRCLLVKTLTGLPSVWDREEDIRQRVSGKSLAVFLDYDGTLTPIVEDHARAWLPDNMRAAVKELGKRCPVVIVSGRDLTMLRGLIELDSVGYAGSHGFEIVPPEGAGEKMERGDEFLPELDQVEQELRKQLAAAAIKGYGIERKRFSIALHYRQVAEDDIEKLQPILDRVLAGHPRLCRGHGKKVFEIKPDIDWNKGYAVLWLLERLGLDEREVLPLYIGDDLTDEDAFQALAGRGICVVVRDHGTRQTAADYTVTDTEDVRRFLEMLALIAIDEKEVDRGK